MLKNSDPKTIEGLTRDKFLVFLEENNELTDEELIEEMTSIRQQVIDEVIRKNFIDYVMANPGLTPIQEGEAMQRIRQLVLQAADVTAASS